MAYFKASIDGTFAAKLKLKIYSESSMKKALQCGSNLGLPDREIAVLSWVQNAFFFQFSTTESKARLHHFCARI